MAPLLYHDLTRRPEPGARLWRMALALVAAAALGCGQTAPAGTPAGPATTIASALPPSSTPPASDQSSATIDAIARARVILARVRAAAGGPQLTNMRSLKAAGTSVATFFKRPRRLTITALYPDRYMQDEAPETLGNNSGGFHTAMTLNGEVGWFGGAVLGGDGQSKDPAIVQRAYTRAARQAMIAFFSGVNVTWLIDPGHLTFVDGGVVDSGDDRGALIVLIDGPDGRAGRLLIDPGTSLPRRFFSPPQPGGGTAALVETVFTFSEFQPQFGVQLPQTIVRESGSNRTTFSIATYTINPTLTPRQFVRPPAKPRKPRR